MSETKPQDVAQAATEYLSEHTPAESEEKIAAKVGRITRRWDRAQNRDEAVARSLHTLSSALEEGNTYFVAAFLRALAVA